LSIHPFKPGDRVLTIHAGRAFRHLSGHKLRIPKRGYVSATMIEDSGEFAVNVQLTEAPWEKWERIPVQFVEQMSVVERLAELDRAEARQERVAQTRRPRD